MANGQFVAYFRVSTKRQGKSGLGLEAQKQAVLDYLNGGRWKLVDEVTEIETGTRKGNDRPALKRALALCRMKDATLIIAKLDRLARNVAFISNLMESGVEFCAVDFPKANRLTVHILAAVAEHEAKMISDRTRAALAAAKARGVKLGGNRMGEGIASMARKGSKVSAVIRHERANAAAADFMEEIRTVRADGATSLRKIASALNERGIKTPRGAGWTAVQVMRVMNRATD